MIARDHHRTIAAVALLALTTLSASAQDNIATNSGNWEDAGNWTLGVPTNTHNVFIPTNITITCNGLNVYAINSLSITGVLTHASNDAVELNKLSLDIANDLTVHAGGGINAFGTGYGWNGNTGYGPGFSISRSGAAYGGEGALSWSGAESRITYGSVTNPVDLGSGSGGRGGDAYGSAGGGAIILQVGGTMTVEATGIITADGDDWNDQSAASGGTVNITANAFAGTGTITAEGGTSGGGRSGAGGGRIALIAGSGDETQFATLAINCRGGDGGGGMDGGAGSIYLRDPTQTYGTLVVSNHNAYTSSHTTFTNQTVKVDKLILEDYALLRPHTGGTLDISGAAVYDDSTTASMTSRLIFGPETNTIVWPAVISNACSQMGMSLYPFGGDLILGPDGILTHEPNSDAEANKLNLDVGGNLTLQAGSAIDVDGQGYGHSGTTGYGPGATQGRAGAGHGGEGSDADGRSGGQTYGSVTNPVTLGSGCGGRTSGYGSCGGGAAILQVGGTVTIDAAAAITSDGGQVQDQSSGAGGSISISANAFAATGTITAIGGTAWAGARGAAGGGRIALIAGSGTPAQFDTLTINARGGDGGPYDGAAGTIYLKAASQTYGSLIVRNYSAYTPALTIWTNESLRFDTILTTNYGILAAGEGALLDLTGTALDSDSTTNAITSRIRFGTSELLAVPYTNRIIWSSSFTNAGCLSQLGTDLHPIPGDVTITPGGIFTHESGLITTTNEESRLNLSITGNLTVQAGGAITATGRGYGGENTSSGRGYGPGGSTKRAGSSHGGQGADADTVASDVTYGSVINPNTYGSGGGSRDPGDGRCGGGAIILDVGGVVTNDGLVDSDGLGLADRSSAAAGSINISATLFSGTGTVSAKGAPGLSNGAGAGGGRIALKASGGDPSQFTTLNITAAGGGTANAGYEDPAAGTVYLEAGSQGPGRGIVRVDNNGEAVDVWTCVPAYQDSVPGELDEVTIIATNGGGITTGVDVAIGDLLVYPNSLWYLGSSTMIVGSIEHSLEDPSLLGPGATTRVDHYDQIIWRGLQNYGVANLAATTADLIGLLNASQTNFDIHVFWGTNDNADSAAWLADTAASNTLVGGFTNAVWLSITQTVSSLSGGTVYYFTMMGSNGTGTTWAEPNWSFSTVSPPMADNAGGAYDIYQTSATLPGELTNGVEAFAYILWGTNNPGTEDTNDWENVENMGLVLQDVTFSTNLAGLPPLTMFYYRCFVTNAAGYDWSDIDTFITANTAVGSGNWESAGTWSGGVPLPSHAVYIPSPHTVTINGLNTNSIRSLIIDGGGRLTHAKNGATITHKIILDITDDFTLRFTGEINVSSNGYAGDQGPGTTGYRGGAAHGGQGGNGSGVGAEGSHVTYGSVMNPVTAGSGNGGKSGIGQPGGGVVIITAGGNVDISGDIEANGAYLQDHGGGAGGSINIRADTFSGSGSLEAEGGDNLFGFSNGGGGGGGRIALVAASGDDTQFQTLTISAMGGDAAQEYGGAGTVYLEASSMNPGDGTVMINNWGQPIESYTSIPPVSNTPPNELVRALVICTNAGAGETTGDGAIGQLLIHENSAWTLGPSDRLFVDSREHWLDDLSQPGPGSTNRVDIYENIIWMRGVGTIITIY